MIEITELYQELILDHAKNPKNFGTLAQKSHSARGHNPLCGDIIDLEILLENLTIKEIAFNGDGCAISKAAASLMTESIKGKPLDSARLLFNEYHHMLTMEHEPTGLGKLLVFKGVKQFPMRVKCATLCWHTLNAALAKKAQIVTTE